MADTLKIATLIIVIMLTGIGFLEWQLLNKRESYDQGIGKGMQILVDQACLDFGFDDGTVIDNPPHISCRAGDTWYSGNQLRYEVYRQVYIELHGD